MKRAARYIIFYAALFGLWTLLAELKVWPPYLFPTPWGVGEALYAGFADHSYWIAIRVSMERVLIGYAISVVLGMILGLGVASNKFLEETMGGLLVSLQSLPSICWWPLALLWFGLNQNAILFVVIMGSLLVGDACHGRWPQANAQNLRPSRTKSWREGFQAVLVCAAAS